MSFVVKKAFQLFYNLSVWSVLCIVVVFGTVNKFNTMQVGNNFIDCVDEPVD